MESKRMETIIRYLEYTYHALLLFGILYIGFFVQGNVQGGDYSLYGESLGFGLGIYPVIVLVMSVYGTIKSKKWFVMPIITLIVLLFWFNIVTHGGYISLILFIPYLVISIVGSGVIRFMDR